MGPPQKSDVPRHPNPPRAQSTNPTTTSPSDLRRVLRQRQLARNRRACLPCRERKVRCDHQQPCQTCLKRGHADLCFYHETGNLSTTISSAAETISTVPPDMLVYGSEVASAPDALPLSHDSETAITTPSLLGGNSIITVARRDSVQPQAGDERRTAFERGIFPLLGMDRDTEKGGLVQEAPPTNSSSLPDDMDQEMTELFTLYRHRVHPFQFVLDDLDDVEKVVCSLMERDVGKRQCDTHFLCLLHAILAAGAQFSDLAPPERVSKFQKHRKSGTSSLPIAQLPVFTPSSTTCTRLPRGI